LLALGSDHILFAADYPFEDLRTATAFCGRPDYEGDRAKIAHGNAERSPVGADAVRTFDELTDAALHDRLVAHLRHADAR
jgi:hypothetical protein